MTESGSRTRHRHSFAALAERAGNWLFARDDTLALANGWQIARRHAGLGRQYRDPRFDTLRVCPSCRGRGRTGDGPCAPCGATGRITVEPIAAGHGGRP